MKSSPENRLARQLSFRFAFLNLLLAFALTLLLTACSGVSASTPSSPMGSTTKAALSPSPSTIDFGTIQSNSTGVTSVLSLTNLGKSSETIVSATIVPTSVFALQGWTGAVTLQPGQKVQLRTTFTPKSAGNYSGTVTLVTRSGEPVEYASPKGPSRQYPPQPHLSQISIPVIGSAVAENDAPPIVKVSLSPSSIALQSSQSKQFTSAVAGTSNTAVTWVAALGSISPSGFYTAPPVSSQTTDTVSAISVADPTKYANASITISPTGGTGGTSFSITNPPPATWYPYEPTKSLLNKPLPANVLQHCFGNTSDCSQGNAMAQNVLTDWGTATNSDRNNGRWGNMIFKNTLPGGASADISLPIYYGQATDPWYHVGPSCHYNSNINVSFHAPSGAIWGALPGNDQHVAVYDVDQGLILEFYGLNSDTGMYFPENTCTSGPSCAMPIPNLNPNSGACAAMQVGVDSDTTIAAHKVTIKGNTWTIGGSTQIFAAMGGALRQNELIAGPPAHALQLGVDCTNSYVYPATGGLFPCSGKTNVPPAGALLFCDYTPTQLSTMKTAGQISLAQFNLLTTFCTYGGYITQTSNSTRSPMNLSASGGREGMTAYQLYYNIPPPIQAWGCANGMNDANFDDCSGGVPKDNLFTPFIDALGSIPLQLGPGGSDYSGNSCTRGEGCDVSGHIHIADSCVAKALAGVAGGCQ